MPSLETWKLSKHAKLQRILPVYATAKIIKDLEVLGVDRVGAMAVFVRFLRKETFRFWATKLSLSCHGWTRSYSSQTPPPTMQGGAIFTVGCKVGVCCYHPLWLDGTQPDRYLPFANSANNQIWPTCVAVMRMRCSRNRRIRRLMNYCVFYVLGSTSNSRKARRAPFEWPRTTCGGLQNATRTLCAIREGACRCRRRAPDVVCPRCDS